MDLFQAILLGLVQGLGEFLPISSSAHLILAPWLFNFPDPGLSFDVALHLGTLIAIVLYFWKDFLEIIISNFQFPISNKNPNYKLQINSSAESLVLNERMREKNQDSAETTNYNKNILWLIVIATIPGALFGYFLEKQAETIFRNPLLIAGTLSLVGLILFLADKYAKHIRNINDIKIKDAVLIGMSQALAIIPGVSRAGSTITTGLFLGLDRISAARFSFLMSAPIIFGATILKLPGFISHGIGFYEIVAVAIAALSGYAAISWMLKFIEKVSYKVFFWYRLALALVIIIVWLIR